MTIEIARYQFHSWARKGIAGNISETDDLGAGTSTAIERAEVPIGVSLNEAGMAKKFSLIGPGDIIGVHRDMVVRIEPLNWITDFEANYLAFMEFYDEEFVWRYTPAAPNGQRLRPWIFLLVLKEDEFEMTSRRSPLPTIKVKTKDAFPPAKETWMWGHVHNNADIPDSDLSVYEKFLLSLNKTLNDDPDQFYCRLLSPRKLEANTPYCAFLIPAFETGRLAGLEQPTAAVNAQMASWTDDGVKGEMPFYYDWSFRTGAEADFESLVKLLQPRPMDSHVGIRDMDCHRPGFVKADGSGELPGTKPEIIGLEGAVKSPTTVSTVFPFPPSENQFQQELQKIVNLPFEIVGQDDSGDPIISVPMYGGKHAKKSQTDIVKLDISKSTWVHDLNKDPRTRAAAGFGTKAVQQNQEYFMRKAWEQVTKVLEANRQIRQTLLYMKVAIKFTEKTFSAVPKNKLLAISRPVLSRIMGSPTTLLQQIRESNVPVSVLSGAFRRMTRPNGKFVKKLSAANPLDYESLVVKLNEGGLTAAPPKKTPLGMPNTQDLAEQLRPAKLARWLLELLRKNKMVFLLLLAVLLVIALTTGTWLLGLILAGAAAGLWMGAQKLNQNVAAGNALTDPQQQAAAVAAIPAQPSFALKLSDEPAVAVAPPAAGGVDSVEAIRFRRALTDFTRRLAIKVPEVPKTKLALEVVYEKVSKGIHPYTTFPNRLSYLVRFPNYIGPLVPEKIFEAIAYPDFEDAMYSKLVGISGELMLPNMKLIPINTISLLKTNQKFIESYLVGLNTEMGSELLWREYPTDERGSYFRQFWEVKGMIRPQQNKTEAQLAEEYKDIKPIHTWSSNSALGSHNNRDTSGKAEQTVLLIRGDLLKRYPNTVIFAQKAIVGSNSDEPVIDLDLTTEDFDTQLKFPLYGAELPPDIKLFGFDLTINRARGTEPSPGFSDNLGWFFVIQEVPGEPRFGMDISFNPGSDGLSWDDLAWDRLPRDTQFIKASTLPNISLSDKSRWGADSANMAYILFQKPSMVAVHAKEMLEDLKEN